MGRQVRGGREKLRAFAAGLLILAVLAPGGTSGAGQRAGRSASSGASFTLGVLRRDGVVVPFASYDGRRWLRRWPAPGRGTDIPISLADTPKRWWLRDRPIASWTAWPARGDSRVVHVKGPVNLTVECQPHVGLQTDYVSSEPPSPPRMQPYPKDGLASDGNVLVDPVELLDEKSPEWTRLASDVAAKVNTAESSVSADAHLPRGFTEKQRADRPLSLEVLFRSKGARPGTTLLYFEGVKRYQRLRLAPDMLSYASGFVFAAPPAPPKIVVTVALSDADREGLLYTMPLGSLRVDGRLYWVVQRSGWGYERYEVLEVTDSEVKTAFETEGGVCQ